MSSGAIHPVGPYLPLVRLRAVLLVLAAAWLLVLAAPAHAQQEVKATASAPEQAYMGDAIPFRILVEGASDAPAPDMSALEQDFEVRYLGPQNNSSNITVIINGRVQQRSERSMLHAYTLAARRAGEFTIPALSLTTGGRTIRTQPLRIRVAEPSRVGGLTAKMDSERAYIGQAVRLSVSWLLPGDIEDPVIGLNFPAESFDVFELSASPGSVAGSDRIAEVEFAPHPGGPRGKVRGIVRTLNLDGDLRAEFIAEFLVVPSKPGRSEVGPARADFRSVIGRKPRTLLDSPFERNTITQRQYAQAEPLPLEVLDLPTRNRPADFSGLVGKFTLDASCSPRDASVGDPLNLTLTLKSPLPILNPPTIDLSRMMSAPAAPAAPGGTSERGPGAGIASLFRVPRDPVLPQPVGEFAVYSAQIRPRSTKAQSVPPIELSYFDPDIGDYRVMRSPPVSLNIKPAAAVGLGALEGLEEDDADSASGEPGADEARAATDPMPERVNGFYPALESSVHEPAASESAWRPVRVWGSLAGALLLALVAAAIFAWSRARRERDPARFRRRGAARRARRKLRAALAASDAAAVAAAMRGLVADLCDLSAQSLTTGEAVMYAARIDPVLGSRLGALLAACDEKMFAPESTRQERAQRAGEAEQIVHELCRAADARGVIPSPADFTPRGPDPRVARLRSRWQWAPLAAWAVGIALVAAMSGGFSWDTRERAIAHHDAGTRAAQAGDMGRAVLEFRRAQRLVVGLLPDPARLADRIDGNLHEARSRARLAATTDSAASADSPVGVAPVPAAADSMAPRRPAADRLFAAVRSVPLSWRIALAAAMVGLALALASSRLIGGTRARMPRSAVTFAACVGAVLLAAASQDALERGPWALGESGGAEAVVMRSTLLREGPDDLTYPPAVLSPLPAGAGVRIKATTPDGLWSRVRVEQAGLASAPEGWLPSAALELVAERPAGSLDAVAQ